MNKVNIGAWGHLLMNHAENGMGYHVVDLFFKEGTDLYAIPVFNCEEIEWKYDFPFDERNITGIRLVPRD